jgi:hypothetical protein
MTVAGVCVVRDAADIIGPVIRHMLAEVDAVVVAEHLSTDDTARILHDLSDEAGGRLWIAVLTDPAFDQSRIVTWLAHLARDVAGADWIVPFDADEVWYSPFGRIADVLDEIPSGWSIASADLYDHVTTGRDDPAELDPTRRIRWRRTTPGPFPKIAARYAPDLTIHDGNHGAHYGAPHWGQPAPITGRLVVRHFPYRSAEQMHRKATIGSAALTAAGLPRETGQHWHDYAQLAPHVLADVYLEHFHAADPTVRRDLIDDPAPIRTPVVRPG